MEVFKEKQDGQQPRNVIHLGTHTFTLREDYFLACSPTRSLLQPKGMSLTAPTIDTDDAEHKTDQRTGTLGLVRGELSAWTQRIQT